MVNEIQESLVRRMTNMSYFARLIDLKGRHVSTSILAALHVSCDVSSYPISHALVIHICVLFDKRLVVIKVRVELVGIFFAQANGSNFYE